MKYRDHKGSLEKSMKTAIEVNSSEEIISHLNKLYNDFGAFIAEIKFEHVGFDSRTGWDTYYVLHRFEGETSFHVSGMSDSYFGLEPKQKEKPSESAQKLIDAIYGVVDNNIQ